jgi:hypothetical protein
MRYVDGVLLGDPWDGIWPVTAMSISRQSAP